MYVDDVQLPGMLHVAMVRSPYPHARIRSIDKSAALALPGVVDVMTGDDLAAICGPMSAGSAEGESGEQANFERVDAIGAQFADDLADRPRQGPLRRRNRRRGGGGIALRSGRRARSRSRSTTKNCRT